MTTNTDTAFSVLVAQAEALIGRMPDNGEGSMFDRASTVLWDCERDYRTADAPLTLSMYEDGMTPDEIRTDNLAELTRHVARWALTWSPPACRDCREDSRSVIDRAQEQHTAR